jgi:hypothetical protein
MCTNVLASSSQPHNCDVPRTRVLPVPQVSDEDDPLPLFHFKQLHINDPDELQAMVSWVCRGRKEQRSGSTSMRFFIWCLP